MVINKVFLNKIIKTGTFKWILFVILCMIVILNFLVINKIIDKRKLREYKITEDMNLINAIEDIYIENNNIVISGYAFLLNRSSIDNSISVILRNVDTMKEIWLDSEQIYRHDVNTYYNSEYDYSYSGILASTNIENLNQDEVYEIIIAIDYINQDDAKGMRKNRKAVSTNKFLLNNQLYSYNRNDFDLPDLNIESELLIEVFTNGRLCFYEKDIGLYLYSYKNKLYWITTNEFEFQEYGHTYILYQLHTTQIDKLPEHRKIHKFDNLDFTYEEYEFINEKTAPYRVAICDIPQEYAITYVKTGVYDKEEKKIIWTKNFHFDNILNK